MAKLSEGKRASFGADVVEPNSGSDKPILQTGKYDRKQLRQTGKYDRKQLRSRMELETFIDVAMSPRLTLSAAKVLFPLMSFFGNSGACSFLFILLLSHATKSSEQVLNSRMRPSFN